MVLTSDRPTLLRQRLANAVRVGAGACIFGAGLLLAGAFTSSAPAAPEDCLPVVGCVTTTVPIVTVTVPTLPGITTILPTLPGATTTSPTATSSTTTTSTATGAGTTTTNAGNTVSVGSPAFNPKAAVRVRGRGAKRVVEIRVTLTKPARLDALLSRKQGRIAKRLFTAKAGPHLFRLRIGRAAKPGLANLSLVYRATTGEAVRKMHRLRLPR